MKTLRGKLAGGLLVWVLVSLAAGLGAQPVITNQPANQTVLLGGNATFSVRATGTGPFTYQWQWNGTNLPNNIITTVAGNGNNGYSGDGGPAANAGLFYPDGVAFDAAGNLFIADRYHGSVRKVDTNGNITTVAGNGTQGNSGDGGAATNATMFTPQNLAFDAVGNLFVSDWQAGRVRKLDTNGNITSVAFGLSQPIGVAVDTAGNLYMGTAALVYKLDTNSVLTVFAGGGTNNPAASNGGAATSAELSATGVAFDASGNLFIADYWNAYIRKVDTNGIITTVAGNGNFFDSGDGGMATNAGVGSPEGVALDAGGNLFISEIHGWVIRKVDTNGMITTVAGTGSNGFSGDGGPATNALIQPFGIALDAAGNLFIADGGNNRVRKVTNTQGPALALNNASGTNAGNYSVIITGPSGSVTSSVVALSVQLPPITPVFTRTNGAFSFTWSAVPNQMYQLQYTVDLTTTNWMNLGSPVTATSNSVSTSDLLGTDQQRFYRIRLWP